MINIVLFEPEIPPNTGNIIRLAANTGAVLHLVQPLGFTLEDRKLRRAGLDYHEFSDIRIHADWETFRISCGHSRLLGFSTKGSIAYDGVRFRPDDYLVFGPETRGLPASVKDSLPPNQLLRIPMLPRSRSLNLSNAVALVVYEAWRQQGFTNGV
ncbi:MAG: tRNA (uridine(34)/cytosine(34)/5-carboxymethylaminomethyluridine(34)-2'-O)-methyltransferase TrmL [Pseudohongiellaceae bacterium]